MGLLAGCTVLPQRVKTETVTVKVPVLYCPAPPKDVLVRPKLPINDIQPGDESDPGKVAQNYKATVKTLQNYSFILEKTVKQYQKYNNMHPKVK